MSGRRVYVRGARGALGRCVADAVRTLDGVTVTVADESIDDGGAGDRDDGARGDGARHDGAPAGHYDTIVDVGIGDHDALGRRGESVTAATAGLLDDVAATGADHVVVLSSAMVYGALANNPIPLTEAAVLRPNPNFVYARQLASAEEAVESWRAARPGRRVATLRPAIPIAAEGTSSLARALTAGFGLVFGQADPDAQFVHHDDVASAVALAVERRLDGVYNVAPDGSVPGDRVRALSGQRFRVPLPGRLADVVSSLRWRFQRGPIPPGLRPYTRTSWVIANDKLRAEGWAPTVTNEQAFVEGTEAKWWTMVTPKRRQELALGGLVALLAALLAVGAVMARRWWLRRPE